MHWERAQSGDFYLRTFFLSDIIQNVRTERKRGHELQLQLCTQGTMPEQAHHFPGIELLSLRS
jgi:hypothetical protein